MAHATAATTTAATRATVTDDELLVLWNRRTDLLRRMGLPAEARAWTPTDSTAFKAVDAAIVAELVHRREPAVLDGGITMVLSSDRRNFITMDARTGRPKYVAPVVKSWSSMVWDYSRPWTEVRP